MTQSGYINTKLAKRLLLLLLCLLVLILSAGCRRSEHLEISFLDVGQGDAVLISQGNTQILIDGGPSPGVLLRQLAGKMSFFDRNIELVVLTHPHADHINGLLGVLRRYDVSQVIFPATGDVLEGYDGLAYEEWLKLIQEKKIPSTIACEGMSFCLGEANFMILNPQKNLHTGTISDVDNNSIVLELSAGDYNFLLTSDLMWQGELELVLERKIRPVNILKVAHHGSNTSSSLEFLSVAKPDMGIICVGENDFGHPDNTIIERISFHTRGGAVIRTDKCEGITFITDGRSLWAEADLCR